MKKTLFAIVIIIGYIFGLARATANDEILRAMRDEINRSMDELQVEGLQKPYYIELTLTVEKLVKAKSTLGAITSSEDKSIAQLNVDVRVGDYKFDNSNFFDFSSFFGSGDDEERFKYRQIPIEMDYPTLRREIWLAVDAAYKQAAEALSKKEAVVKNRVRKDTTSDFLRVEPKFRIDTTNIPEFDISQMEELCRSLSARFRDYPGIHSSCVNMEYIPKTIYYVNSEGVEYVKTDLFTGLEIVASTQAEDGAPVADFFSAYAKNPKDLPDVDSLNSAVDRLIKTTLAMRDAEILFEPYSGPIIFEGQAAAELFAQIFIPNLVAQRSPITEQGVREDGKYKAFQTKIGGRVLPEFLSVDALPSKNSFENTPLMGSYKIDDEGVPAQDVNLVKDGYLKNLLSSRVPIRRVRKTNGHMRGGAAMYSSIFIESSAEKSKSAQKLRERALELAEARELPFALVVKKIINLNIMRTTIFDVSKGVYEAPGANQIPLAEVYKLYPDGREELVRGCVAKGFTVQSFKDILLAGEKRYAYNLLAPSVSSTFLTGGSLYVGASVATPDVLFEDGEIKSGEEDYPKPPIIANPTKK